MVFNSKKSGISAATDEDLKRKTPEKRGVWLHPARQ
jgi:hypothetical protein